MKTLSVLIFDHVGPAPSRGSTVPHTYGTRPCTSTTQTLPVSHTRSYVHRGPWSDCRPSMAIRSSTLPPSGLVSPLPFPSLPFGVDRGKAKGEPGRRGEISETRQLAGKGPHLARPPPQTRDTRGIETGAVRLAWVRDPSVHLQHTTDMTTCAATCRPTTHQSRPTARRFTGGKSCRCKAAANGTRVVALMNFGKKLRMDSESAGVFASQGRDDYSESDVQYYFEYAGMLAVEKTYDKMDQLLATGVAPVDLLLLMAASEGDRQKIEELMRAGASHEIKDIDGRTALDRACDDEIRELILSFSN